MSLHWENFVFAIVAFTILYLLLNKYAVGPLMGVMEQRRKLVADQIESSEKNRLEAERLLAEQQKALQEVRSEASNIIELAKASSKKQSESIIEQAKEEATRLKDGALRDIEDEKNKAISALRSQVSAMSVMIASKIIEKQVDEQSQSQLVEQYLKEVGGKQ
ncbi:F0F1 ATP synthase subunit B [Paenibacillus puerhi]|uniref:F0F1 ATP synthase subunit B n=1 Tax=Paenibacillus puerhi TaxID=2692622 RepID=UPI00135A9A66|nr:F0F1 ATP synthase subunit B [Paenibacillus puerhi]